LVVDDGSTDDTPERVKRYGSRIRYHYKPNGGQASALNFGINEARFDIIAFLDADDLFVPDKLSRISEAFAQNPALGMVYHPYIEWYSHTDQRLQSNLPLVSGDVRTDPLAFLNFMPYATSSVILRKSCLAPLLPIPEHIRMLADCFLVQLVPLLAPVLAIPEPLTVYRIHGKNHYYAEDQSMPKEVAQVRLELLRTLYDAMRAWLDRNGYSASEPPVRFFRARWYRDERYMKFRFNPPGRLQFFLIQLRHNYAYAPTQSWKFTLFNYLWAFLALLSGYRHWDRVYRWRCSLVERMSRQKT
jgi:glycosyltransferase involved in cell wall biosynthesis